MAEKEDKITITQFKDGSSNWMVGYRHYILNENNEIEFVAGGGDKTEEDFTALSAYIKRNKKTYQERIESAQIVSYDEKIPIGKYKDLTVSELFVENVGYLRWMILNYNFGAQLKLKQEITDILKQ